MAVCPTTGRSCLTLTAFEVVDMAGPVPPTMELLQDQEDYHTEEMISMGQQICNESECGVAALANVVAVRTVARQIAVARNRPSILNISQAGE